jgi:nicotinic acid mononucleotide adenylyltransferase
MTGVILFRAQPFHRGHLNMVKKAFEDSRNNNGDLYIFVGSANKCGTERNPLPIDFRLMLIEGTLHDEFTTEELKHIHIYALDDMTDEADNTHAWGRYLYIKMFSKTKDTDMTIYYSDDPRIMLSWFAQDERWLLRFKFLDRFENISATRVRNTLKNQETPDDYLKLLIPQFVLNYKEEIRDYLSNTR